jgi:hypothetical protein
LHTGFYRFEATDVPGFLPQRPQEAVLIADGEAQTILFECKTR